MIQLVRLATHCQVPFSTMWTGYPVGFALGIIIIKVMNHWQELRAQLSGVLIAVVIPG